jgi:uncharacterized protein YjbI with pentapeptide repeats
MLSTEILPEYDQETFTDVSGVECSEGDFSRCRFQGCDLTERSFGNSLDRCVFEECNLSLVSFKGAKLQGVRFTKCKLLGVDFTICHMLGFVVGFTDCLVQSCNFNYLDLRKTAFKRCEFRETDFIGANLAGSDFTGSVFSAVTFHDTNLTKADFSEAQGYAINPLTNKIQGARFQLPDAIALLENLGIRLG